MSPILSLALSGLAAQSKRLEISASNIVNRRSTGVEPGAAPRDGEYAPQRVALKSRAGGGVEAIAAPIDPASVAAFEPGAPDADATGLVNRPNVRLERELVNQIEALRGYQAGLSVIRTESRMMGDLINLIT